MVSTYPSVTAAKKGSPWGGSTFKKPGTKNKKEPDPDEPTLGEELGDIAEQIQDYFYSKEGKNLKKLPNLAGLILNSDKHIQGLLDKYPWLADENPASQAFWNWWDSRGEKMPARYWSVGEECAPGSLGSSFYPSVSRWCGTNSFGSCSAWTCSTPGPTPLADPTTDPLIFGYHNQTSPCGGGANRAWVKTSVAGRKTGAPVPTPLTGFLPMPGPSSRPIAAPIVRPLAVPTYDPAEETRPWVKANPGEEPSAKPDDNKDKDAPPNYDLPVQLVGVPVVFYGTDVGVNVRPVTQVLEVNSRGGITYNTAPPPDHPNAPVEGPGRKETKKKPTIMSAFPRTYAAINLATEGIDFVEAMWKAIPEEQRTKGADVPTMFVELWDNWEKIDLSTAVENFVNMQIEDMLWAMLSAPTKKVSQELGIITGLDKAVSDAMNTWLDPVYQAEHTAKEWMQEEDYEDEHPTEPHPDDSAEIKALKEKIKEAGGLDQFMPQVDFNLENGEVTVSIPAAGSVTGNSAGVSFRR